MGINMSNLKINHLLTLSILSIGLTACGGSSSGSGSGPTVHTGVFKDSTVSGLSYVSGGQKGTTKTNGEFNYEEAGDVTFSVGGVNLGTGEGKNIMTPIDLVKDGKIETPDVFNRVRFLMMLDKDNDAKNGIEISNDIQNKFESLSSDDKAVDFSVKAEDFKSEIGYLRGIANSINKDDSRPLPTYEDATNHLTDTIDEIKRNQRCADAGGFVGQYSGDESGNIALVLDPTPETGVYGYTFNETINYPVEVTSKTNYDIAKSNFVSEGALGNQYTGTLVSGNSLEGKWVNESKNSGTFSADRLASNSGASNRYVAKYIGDGNTNHGILVFNETSNKISGEMYDATTGKTLAIKEGTIKNTKFDITLDSGENIDGNINTTTSKINGYIVSKDGKISNFTGTGCELN